MKNSISFVAICFLFFLQMATLHAQDPKYKVGDKVFFCLEPYNKWVDGTVVRYFKTLKKYEVSYTYTCDGVTATGPLVATEDILFKENIPTCPVCGASNNNTGNGNGGNNNTGNNNTPPPLPAGAVNLALNKTAFKFCHATTAENDPKKTVDGNTATFFETDGGATPHHHHNLEIDLGDEYSVNRIALSSDVAQEDLYVIVSKNQLDRSLPAEQLISQGTKHLHCSLATNEKVALYFEDAIGRYVLIVRKLKNDDGSGAARLRLGELEVWGRFGGTPFDPAKGMANFSGMPGECPSTLVNAPQIIAHPNGDGSFDVAWQDMTPGSRKIFLNHYAFEGSGYAKDAAQSSKLDGMGFLAGFTKGDGHRYVMTGEPWSNRDDVKQVKIFKDNNVLWVGKKYESNTCRDINALLYGGSARLALAGNKLMAEFNTGPTHPYQVILDVNSPNQNTGKCSYQKYYQHCFDNDLLFDGTDFVVLEKLDHDIGLGMMKFSPNDAMPFDGQNNGHNGRLRSVYAHTNFGNSTFLELGDLQPGLDGGYLVLFASERDWDNKMTGYVAAQPWAPVPMSPQDIALLHVKKDFNSQPLNWKNSTGTANSQAPKVVNNSSMVNSVGSGKTVTYPSANDGWPWEIYNCCAVLDEIKAGMTHRQQITTGVKWLTSYGVPFENANRKGNPGEQFTHVRFPKLVKISDAEYIAIWEEHTAEIGVASKTYLTTKTVKISLSSSGGKVSITNGSIKDIGQVRLMPDDDAFNLDGKAAWLTGDPVNLKLRLFTLDENLTLTETLLDL